MPAISKRLRTTGVTLAAAALALSLAAVGFAAPDAGDISVTGEHKAVGGVDYYTDDVTLSVDATSAEGLKKAELTINGQNAGTKDLEGTAQTVTFEVDKGKLAQLEPENYRYEAAIKLTDTEDATKTVGKTFYADASKPDISITGVENGTAYNASKTPKITMTDKNIGRDDAAVVVKKDGAAVKTENDIDKCKDFDSYTASEDGKYRVEASIAGKAQRAEAAVEFTVDKTAPQLSEIALSGEKKEGYEWYTSDVTAKLTASDTLSGIDGAQVSLNGTNVGNAAISGSELSFTVTEQMIKQQGGTSGAFTVRFDVYDKAGNKSSKEANFNASVEAPEVNLTGIANGSYTNKAPQIKAAASQPEKTSRVEMSVKRGGVSVETITNDTSCTYVPAQDGLYEITAKLTDKAGNISEEKTLSFTYDTKKPQLAKNSIDGPLKGSYKWYYDHVVLEAEMTDELSGLASCSIEVNGKVMAENNAAAGSMTEKLEKTLDRQWFLENESEDGEYKIVYRAADRAGNLYESEAAFHADVITPKVELSGIKDGTYTNDRVKIEAEVDDNYPKENEIYFTITRNGQLCKEFSKSGEKASFDDFNKDGNYKVSVKSIDKAGNESEVKTVSFTRDTVAPVISISGAKANSYTRGAKNLQAHVKELNYHNMTVGGDIYRTLDGKKTGIGWGSIKPNKVDYTYTKRVNGTGTYTVTLNAVDKAGNRATPKSLTFTIDNDKPIVKITNVKDLNGYADVVAPKAFWEDSYYASHQVRLTRVSGESPAGLSSKEKKNAKGGTRTFANFSKQKEYDDIYTLTVTCVDKAGNRTSVSKTFTVCRFGSRFVVNKSSRPFNGAFKKDMTETVHITETNPAGIVKAEGLVTRDGARTDAQVKTTMGTKKGWPACTYEYPADVFAEEGIYELDARSSDKAGNDSSFKDMDGQFRLTIDRTPPVISITGVEEGGRYTQREAVANVSVSDTIGVGAYEIDFAGKSLYNSAGKTPPATKETLLTPGVDQTLLVKATDRAGNEASSTVERITVSDSALVRFWANKPLVGGTAAGVAAIAAALALLMARKRKKSE